jgi:hypothetical protein
MSFKSNLKSLFCVLFVVVLILVSFSFILPVWFPSNPNRIFRTDFRPGYKQYEGSQALVVQPVHETVLGQSLTYLPYLTSFHSIIIDYHDKKQAEKTDIFLRSLIRPQNELARSSIREIRVNGRDYYGNWALVEEVSTASITSKMYIGIVISLYLQEY